MEQERPQSGEVIPGWKSEWNKEIGLIRNSREYQSLDEQCRRAVEAYIKSAETSLSKDNYPTSIVTVKTLVYNTAREQKSSTTLLAGMSSSEVIKAARRYAAQISQCVATTILDEGIAKKRDSKGIGSPHDITFIPDRYTRAKVLKLVAKNLGGEDVDIFQSEEGIRKLHESYRYAVHHYKEYLGLPVPEYLESFSITGQNSIWELAKLAKIEKQEGNVRYVDERGPVACCLLKIASARYQSMKREIDTFLRIRRNLYEQIRIDHPQEYPWFTGEINDPTHEYQLKGGGKTRTITTKTTTEREERRRLISMMNSSPTYDTSSWEREGYGFREYVKRTDDIYSIIMLHAKKLARRRQMVDKDITTSATILYNGLIEDRVLKIRTYLSRNNVDCNLTKTSNGENPIGCTLMYDISLDPESTRASDLGTPFWINVTLDNDRSISRNRHVQEADDKLKELARLLGYIPEDYTIAMAKEVMEQATKPDGKPLFARESLLGHLHKSLRKWGVGPVGSMGSMFFHREHHDRLKQVGLVPGDQ